MVRSIQGERNKPTHCALCSKATYDGKKYCSKHVENEPYIQHVMAINERLDNELTTITSGGRINLDMIPVQEVLRFLSQDGSKSAEGLAREVNFPVEVVNRIYKFLENRKIITIKQVRQRYVGTIIADYKVA